MPPTSVTPANQDATSLASTSMPNDAHARFEGTFRTTLLEATKPTFEERNLMLLAARMCLQYSSRSQEIISILAADGQVPAELKLSLRILVDCATNRPLDNAQNRGFVRGTQLAGEAFITHTLNAYSADGYTFSDQPGRLVSPNELRQAGAFMLLARDAAYWFTVILDRNISFPIPEIEQVRVKYEREEKPRFVDPESAPGFVPLASEKASAGGVELEHNPTYAELLLIWWEEEFKSYEPGCYNLDLMVQFFEKRGKPEIAKQITHQHIEHALGFDHQFDRHIASKAAERYLTPEDRVNFTFRHNLKEVLNAGDGRLEAIATELDKRGFDLRILPFETLLANERGERLSAGDRRKLGDPAWLASIMAGQSPTPSTSLAVDDRIKLDPEAIRKNVRELRDFHAKNPKRYDIAAFADLFEGLAEVSINPTSIHQSRLFQKLSGLNPVELFGWARAGDASEDLSDVLAYATNALKDKAVAAELGVGFCNHLALLIYGVSLIRNPGYGAKNLLADESIGPMLTVPRAQAATRLAWGYLSAKNPDSDWEPSKADKLSFVARFRDHLADIPTISAYIKILDAEPGYFPKGAIKVITGLDDLELMETLLVKHDKQVELVAELKARFIQCFAQDTEFGILRGIFDHRAGDLLQEPVFCRWVTAEDRTRIQDQAIRDCLAKDGGEDAAAKLIRFALRPEFQRYLPADFNTRDVIMRLILDEGPSEHHMHVIRQEFALPEHDNISFMAGSQRENYFDIQLLLEKLPPADRDAIVQMPEYQNFVTWYLVGEMDCTSHTGASLSYLLLAKSRLQDNPDLTLPAHLQVNRDPDALDQPWNFISGIYTFESERGAIDEVALRTGLINIVTRGNYTHPRRFYPHTDKMLNLLHSPLARFLPRSGPASIMLRPYYVLDRFLA